MFATSLAPLLKNAVHALPIEQRKALELRGVQQLDYEEVAGAMGCSQNAARLRVSRALRALGLKGRGAEASPPRPWPRITPTRAVAASGLVHADLSAARSVS